MPRLLGNTYGFGKALPKINGASLIAAMETGGHMGQKLQRQAERLGLKPAQVAKLFDVQPPSVYDWYKHGRIHKKHYPVLVAEFGKPLEWWLDLDSPAPKSTANQAAQHSAKALADYSAEALALARLFDLIPAHDVLSRAQAQTICGQAIIDLLHKTAAAPTRKAPGNKTPSR